MQTYYKKIASNSKNSEIYVGDRLKGEKTKKLNINCNENKDMNYYLRLLGVTLFLCSNIVSAQAQASVSLPFQPSEPSSDLNNYLDTSDCHVDPTLETEKETPLITLKTGDCLVYQVPELTQDSSPVSYKLVSGPVGVHVVERTGRLTWAPTSNQVNTDEAKPDEGQADTISVEVTNTDGSVKTHKLDVKVLDGGKTEPSGLFVVPGGGDDKTGDGYGTASKPYNTLEFAAQQAHAQGGGTIYIRGGHYEFRASIFNANDITIRPWHGETVTIKHPTVISSETTPAPLGTTPAPSDNTTSGKKTITIELKNSKNIKIQSLELVGGSEDISFEEMIKQYFWKKEKPNPHGGFGIRVTGDNSENVTIEGCVIHGYYKKAIDIGHLRYMTVRNNIIHAINWTSLANGHGLMRFHPKRRNNVGGRIGNDFTLIPSKDSVIPSKDNVSPSEFPFALPVNWQSTVPGDLTEEEYKIQLKNEAYFDTLLPVNWQSTVPDGLTEEEYKIQLKNEAYLDTLLPDGWDLNKVPDGLTREEYKIQLKNEAYLDTLLPDGWDSNIPQDLTAEEYKAQFKQKEYLKLLEDKPYRTDIIGNLIFDVYQRIYSWGGGPEKQLTSDEGNSIMIEDSPDLYSRTRVAHNLILWGRAFGISANSTPNLEILNNVIVKNDGGPFRTSKGLFFKGKHKDHLTIKNNAVYSYAGSDDQFDTYDKDGELRVAAGYRLDRLTGWKDFQHTFEIMNNYQAGGGVISGVRKLNKSENFNNLGKDGELFEDQEDGKLINGWVVGESFRIADAIQGKDQNVHIGVAEEHLLTLEDMIERYGVEVKYSGYCENPIWQMKLIIDSAPDWALSPVRNYDFKQISSSETMPSNGNKLLIVKSVNNNSYHVRIFNESGKIMLDREEVDFSDVNFLNSDLQVLKEEIVASLGNPPAVTIDPVNKNRFHFTWDLDKDNPLTKDGKDRLLTQTFISPGGYRRWIDEKGNPQDPLNPPLPQDDEDLKGRMEASGCNIPDNGALAAN